MDRLPALSADVLFEQTREDYEQLIREVAAVVNAAPDGRVVNDSEEQVRDLIAKFRERVYQKALQGRVDAAEAAFFPGGPSDGA